MSEAKTTVSVTCPHCGDVTQHDREHVLPRYTCGSCDWPFDWPERPVQATTVCHPSEIIADELAARGWDRWTLAHRMGGDPAQNRLVLDLYCEVGPGEPGMLLGEPTARQLGAAFGTSPDVWLNLETAWRQARAH